MNILFIFRCCSFFCENFSLVFKDQICVSVSMSHQCSKNSRSAFSQQRDIFSSSTIAKSGKHEYTAALSCL